jgi:hypothetical protein
MAAKKFLRLVANVWTEVFGVQTSAGAANAGDIPALDDTGRLDSSMMPVGFGAETKTIAATEALSAGDLVNIYNSSGLKCRKADGSSSAKRAHGYVLAAVANGANATVYYGNINNQLSGLTIGDELYLSDSTPGAVTNAAGLTGGSGHISQRVGVATAATEALMEIEPPVVLA